MDNKISIDIAEYRELIEANTENRISYERLYNERVVLEKQLKEIEAKNEMLLKELDAAYSKIHKHEELEDLMDECIIDQQNQASKTVNLHTKKLFAIVHDGSGDHKDYKEAQAFTVYTSELSGLLELCKRDKKYIELEIDYSEEE